MSVLRTEAEDDVIDVFDSIVNKLHASADQQFMKERHRSRRRFERALSHLVTACGLLLDRKIPDKALRRSVFANVPEECLAESWGEVRGQTEQQAGGELRHFCRRYTFTRKFLPELLDSLELDAVGGAHVVMDATDYLRQIEGRRHTDFSDAPMGHADRRWRQYFDASGRIDRATYTLSVVDALREGLRQPEAPSARGTPASAAHRTAGVTHGGR